MTHRYICIENGWPTVKKKLVNLSASTAFAVPLTALYADTFFDISSTQLGGTMVSASVDRSMSPFVAANPAHLAAPRPRLFSWMIRRFNFPTYVFIFFT